MIAKESTDDSIYFPLALAKNNLYISAELTLYCSPLFGRESKKIILNNFQQIELLA